MAGDGRKGSGDGSGDLQGDPLDAALDAWARPATLREIEAAGERGWTRRGEADAALRALLVERLGLAALDRFTFDICLTTLGPAETALDGVIEAELAQPCVVTLEPVPQAIREPVRRRWLGPKLYAERLEALRIVDEGAAGDAGDDGLDPTERGALGLDLSAEGADELEPLTDPIRPGPALFEALSLALDPYPRAPDAAFEGVLAAPPGLEALTDADAKPFASLIDLRARLAERKEGEGGDEPDGAGAR